MTANEDKLWLVAVTIPDRYFDMQIAAYTPPGGTAEDAKRLVQVDLDELRVLTAAQGPYCTITGATEVR